ncbi:squalene/phytoene synthase family protein [Micromonospora sp. NPDC050397]|uniref:squalene/phytoene synthase family protein n=1 Tax=Micromonospora sp. NPDC050397 TaxID=3364279 RepID=UPI0038509A9D
MLELTGNVSSQPPGDPTQPPGDPTQPSGDPTQASGDPAALRRIPQTALSGENFPVALRILPGATRRHLLALYGYARYVDDLGDEPVQRAHPGTAPAPDDESAQRAHPGTAPALRDGPGQPPAAEPALDPFSEPATDPPGRPPRDPSSQPALDPFDDPATDPSSDPARDPGSAPARDPVNPDPFDDPRSRSAVLRRFEDELRAVYDGRPPTHPVLVALAPTIADRRLPLEPLRRLIAANQRDQVVHRYESYADLVDYCHLSADPVGELVLHVFEAQSARRIALSNHVCTALQVIEHLQDVAEDYSRGRIYLPREDLDRYGVAPSELAAPYASPGLRAVIRLQAERAGAALDAGAPLVGDLHGWARLAVAGYLAGGRAALAALARSDHDPLVRVPRPTRAGTAGQWLRTLIARPT